MNGGKIESIQDECQDLATELLPFASFLEEEANMGEEPGTL